MKGGLRWTPEMLDQFRQKQHRQDFGPRDPTKLYGYVGDANANDKPKDGIPILTDIVEPGDRKRKATIRRSAVPYYQQLCELLRRRGIPAPTPEFRFDASRKYRADFAWTDPHPRLLLEIDGAIWQKGGGGHSHPSGILRDMEKGNRAAICGYRVLRFQPDKVVEAAQAVADVFAEPWR